MSQPRSPAEVATAAAPHRFPGGAESRYVVWEMRLVTALGLPAPVTAVVVAAFLLVTYQALHSVFGSWPWVPDADTGLPLDPASRAAIITSLLAGYVLAVGQAVSRADFRDLQALGLADPDVDPRRDALRIHAIDRQQLRAARVAALVGAAVGLLGVAAVSAQSAPSLAAAWGANLAWFLVAMPILASIVARAAVATVWSSRRISEAVERGVAIDLIDLRPFQRIGALALRGALVWIIGISLASLYFLSAAMRWPMVPIMVVTPVFAVLALVVPVQGVRRRLRAAKREELAAIDAALRRARDAVIGGGEADSGRLADLLAWRAHVEGLGEWPFDTSTYVRFALYLLIPVGSWLGGAFVERALGALLD